VSRRDPLNLRHSVAFELGVGLGALALTVAAVAVGASLGKVSHASIHQQVYAWTCAVVVVVAGSYAVRHLATALGRAVAKGSTLGAGASIRLVASGFGYLVIIFSFFGVLGLSLTHLLVGAGLVGVVLGIAAQQSLGNIFAAVVLLFARPFVVGDSIRIRSGVVGTIDVTVLGIGLTYVTVKTDDGVLKIPNSIVLGSGIGRPAGVGASSDGSQPAAASDDPAGE
jgi:small-conductance mechanosensitive channel